jgi:alpha-glucosidase (family GH31 glycosyl hydrolase)
MSMNMFGFTHSGVDACGSLDAPGSNRTQMDEELCLRWIQLQTFFPLARHSQNFNKNDAYLTGPLGFKQGPGLNSLKRTMRDRLQYLRFMYTCLFEASEWGGSCIDPVYFHFTKDLRAMDQDFGANDTFMFGGAVKVSPILQSLTADQKTFKSHFPQGRWLNLANWKVVDQKADGEVDLDAT